MAHLFRVIVPVGNIERAAWFYQRVLGSEGQRVSPGRHYFECEGTILACYDPTADGDDRPAVALPEPVYLAVDDLESVYRSAAEAGATLRDEVSPMVGPLGQIAWRPWGEHSFYAADPFGNPLCFVARHSRFTGRQLPQEEPMRNRPIGVGRRVLDIVLGIALAHGVAIAVRGERLGWLLALITALVLVGSLRSTRRVLPPGAAG